MQERTGITSFMGKPVTLLGPELKVGDKAPDFRVFDNSLNNISLADFKGKTKISCAVPSLDTPVCNAQACRLNLETASLPDDIAVLIISMDLPFAQIRRCAEGGFDRVTLLSDYGDRSFGLAYGVVIKDMLLLSRSIFVVDGDDTIQYIQHVPEITDEPDYIPVLGVARGLVIAVKQVPME
jgi:thiol peroxidase